MRSLSLVVLVVVVLVRVATPGVPLRGRLALLARRDAALRFSLPARLSVLARLYAEVAR